MKDRACVRRDVGWSDRFPFFVGVVCDSMVAGVVTLDIVVVFEVHCLRGAGRANGVDPSAFGTAEVSGPAVFWVSAGWVSRLSDYQVSGISELTLWTKVEQVRNGG